MKRATFIKLYFLLSIIELGAFYPLAWASDTPIEENLAFNVFLGDKLIGNHEVTIKRDNNKKSVVIRADFDVRFMFIPVYSYNHESREYWKDGCLETIHTTTDDNGDDYYINTSLSGDALEIETKDGVKKMQGCVRTFAYWNPELLNSERLLNTQNGKYQKVSITDLGTAPLTINDFTYQTRQYRLVCEDKTIDLWYSNDRRWLALETETDSGALLRYLPEQQTIAGLDRL